jgi:hypothetical protein
VEADTVPHEGGLIGMGPESCDEDDWGRLRYERENPDEKLGR